MLRYNEPNMNENCFNPTHFLDMSKPITNSIEEDLLAQYFWSQDCPSFDFAFGEGIVEDSLLCDPLSFLSSRGTTTLSSNTSETDSADEESEMGQSHKLTEATRDTSNYHPTYEMPTQTKSETIQREIFLISKLKKRSPRRSFDLGELLPTQEIIFEENEPAISLNSNSNSNMCVDKEKLSTLYNKLVDDGFCSSHCLKGLNSAEVQILEIMFKLRLVLTKAIPENYKCSLTSNLEELSLLLGKTTQLKKRSEELLKKNFKTTLKIMLDMQKKFLPKGVTASQARNHFTEKYFGTKAREYDRIFKCIQMSQDYYLKIFSFPTFKKDFSEGHKLFMNQFHSDRISKTQNLISQIKSDLLSGKEIKMNLRTPWSLKEAEAAMKLMSQFL